MQYADGCMSSDVELLFLHMIALHVRTCEQKPKAPSYLFELPLGLLRRRTNCVFPIEIKVALTGWLVLRIVKRTQEAML